MTTLAELEQRVKETEAAYRAVTEEELALSEAHSAVFPKVKAAAIAQSEARAALETARRGGPLAPEVVAEALREAGYDHVEDFIVEPATTTVPLPYQVRVRPATREGQQMPWLVIRDALTDAGYEVSSDGQRRYRLKGEPRAEWYSVMAVQRAA
jgi:hypothetical protein